MSGDQENQTESKSAQSARVHTGIQRGRLTQERLKELLKYNSETGEFHWLKNGKLTGYSTNNVYTQIYVDGKNYRAHRLAWLYVYGYFPESEVDHINRIKNDNRILNLREASRTCNMRNMAGHGSSGVKGVHRNRGNWSAEISVSDKRIKLGTFSTLFAAAKARVEAEEKYGFVDCDNLSEAKLFVINNPDDGGGRARRKIGRSGVVGVIWHKKSGKWMAVAKEVYLGIYETIQEAEEAIKRRKS